MEYALVTTLMLVRAIRFNRQPLVMRGRHRLDRMGQCKVRVPPDSQGLPMLHLVTISFPLKVNLMALVSVEHLGWGKVTSYHCFPNTFNMLLKILRSMPRAAARS